MALNIKNFFLERPIRLNDVDQHKIIWKRGFFAAFIYSIIYGFYEYFVVYTNIRLYDIMGSTINWSIMYIALIITVSLATCYKKKLNIEHVIFGLLFMAVFEDVIYWIGQWIDTGMCPFPAANPVTLDNWWDNTFASYRVLGNLGQPLPFWPYFPKYYIPGYAMILGYYTCCKLGPKASRIYAWIVGPLFLAVLGGALVSEDFHALLILIILPTISYIYVLLILYLDKRKNID